MSWIGSVIGAGIEAGSSIAANTSGKRQAKKARKWQTSERESMQKWAESRQSEELRQQYAKDAYDWNNYKSPLAYRNALREAGMNPDLAYSQQSGFSPSSVPSTPDTPGAPSAHLPATSSGESSMIAAGQTLANAALAESQIGKNRSDARASDSVTLLNGSEVSLNSERLKLTSAQTKHVLADIRTTSAMADKFLREAEKLVSEKAFIEASTAEKNQIIKELQSSFDDRMATYAYQHRKAMFDAGISQKTYETFSDFAKATLNLLNSQSYNNRASGDFLNEQRRGLFYSNEIEKLRSHWLKNGVAKDLKGQDKAVFDILTESFISQITGSAGMLQSQLELFQDYGELEAIMGIVNQTISAIGSVVSGVLIGKGLKTPRVSSSTTVPSTFDNWKYGDW